jgi:hypothetical protein
MREIRLSGSVEGVVSNHDPYSDCLVFLPQRATENSKSECMLIQLTPSTAADDQKQYDALRQGVNALTTTTPTYFLSQSVRLVKTRKRLAGTRRYTVFFDESRPM